MTNDVVSLLQLLKRSEPSDSVLRSIKSRVYKETGITKTERGILQSLFAYYRLPLAGSFVLLFAVLVYGYHVLTVNPMDIARTRLHSASTALAMVSKTPDLLAMESTLDDVQSSVSQLDLRGIPGKYTSDECKAVYVSYENFITSYKDKLRESQNQNGSSDPKLVRISEKISQYESDIESKWPGVK